MQLLQARRLCTLVAASRHLHSLQERRPPRLIRALCDSRLLSQRQVLSNRLLHRARGWHTNALLLQGQRRCLALRGGESADRSQRETRHVCLELDGLTCGSCVSKAERAILAIDGVIEVGESHTEPHRCLNHARYGGPQKALHWYYCCAPRTLICATNKQPIAMEETAAYEGSGLHCCLIFCNAATGEADPCCRGPVCIISDV